MKLHDYVCEKINEYPSLYASVGDNFTDAEMRVLDQLFLVNGNGLEWAHTKDPSKGGYLADYRCYKRNGEWIRSYDPPYGKQKYTGPPVERYFQEPYFRVNTFPGAGSDRIWEGFESEIPEEYREHIFKNSRDFLLREHHVVAYQSNIQAELHPYPFWASGWPFVEIEHEPGLVKPDWRDGMIRCFEWALPYFKGEVPYPEGYKQGTSTMEERAWHLERALKMLKGVTEERGNADCSDPQSRRPGRVQRKLR